MADLVHDKKAQRLRIYIGESDRWRGKPLCTALLETFRAQGVAGATVFRAVAGFGAHSRIRTAAVDVLSQDPAVVIEVVDDPEKIAAVLDTIYAMVREGLITLENVQMVKYTHRFLSPLPADRLVSEVMTREVVTLEPRLPVYQAWKVMLANRLKAMPVVDPEKHVIGILTDEDLLERAGIQQRLSVALRLDSAETRQELRTLENSKLTVGEVMSAPVQTISTGDCLGVAVTRMVKAGLKRLPVVDSNQKLVGVISRLDILREVAQSPTAAAQDKLPAGAVRTVKEIMSATVPGVNQDASLAEVIDQFARTGSHRLIVVDADGKAIGLVSDSDVVARVAPSRRRTILDALRSRGQPPAGKETAYDLMSPGPLTALPDQPIVTAVQKMLAESRKWLVVVNEEGRPLGLVDRQILLEILI